MLYPKPIESLAAFAIAFAAGAISVSVLAVYGEWMKKKGAKSTAS